MKSIILSIILLLTGCTSAQPPDINAGVGMGQNTYNQINQEEAKEMMSTINDYIILDVRRQDEYVEGHIPGAICIPNEQINCDSPEALPDYNQTILIYCRSGNRSKQAAQKLASMGYTNVYEFGGIIDWTGEIVTGEEKEMTTATLTFSSFDGGGPEYSIKIDDPTIVSYSSSRHYHKPNHEEMTGAGYDVIFTFTGLKPGETNMTVEERSPIADNADIKYIITVDDKLNVEIVFLSAEDMGY